MLMRVRGFEVVSSFVGQDIVMPARKTQYSAGYDISALGDYVIEPQACVKIATGLKVCMLPDAFLGLHVRSSLAIKQELMLVNSQGIIDCDYYNNPDNEGHIIIVLRNLGQHQVVIRNGERIAQGIFYKYLCVDNEVAPQAVRSGGTGSTGK